MIRTAYLKKAEERLKSLVSEINRLRLKSAREESPEIKAKYREQIAMLDARLDAVRESLRNVREALAGAWGASKTAADKSIGELGKAIDAAIEKFRKSA